MTTVVLWRIIRPAVWVVNRCPLSLQPPEHCTKHLFFSASLSVFSCFRPPGNNELSLLSTSFSFCLLSSRHAKRPTSHPSLDLLHALLPLPLDHLVGFLCVSCLAV